MNYSPDPARIKSLRDKYRPRPLADGVKAAPAPQGPWEPAERGGMVVVRHRDDPHGEPAGVHHPTWEGRRAAEAHAAYLNGLDRRLRHRGFVPHGDPADRAAAFDAALEDDVPEGIAGHVSGYLASDPEHAKALQARKALRQGSRVTVSRPRHVATGLSPETGPARVLNPRLRTGHNRERQISYEIEGEEGLEEGVADPSGLRRSGKSLGGVCCAGCASGGACDSDQPSLEARYAALRREEDRLWGELHQARAVGQEVRVKALSAPLALAHLGAVAEKERELHARIARNVQEQRSLLDWACGPGGVCPDASFCPK
jgi:hypothetical protein